MSGCTHACRGCFNEQTWDFKFGHPYTEEVEDEIMDALRPKYIRGLTLLGGEPMEPKNQRSLVKLLERVRREYPQKSVWCYTGYLFDRDLLKESRARCEYTDEMLSLIDVIVDGEFELDRKDITLLFRGSSNQRLIDVKQSLAAGEIVLVDESAL